jgi:hypothetical protein
LVTELSAVVLRIVLRQSHPERWPLIFLRGDHTIPRFFPSIVEDWGEETVLRKEGLLRDVISPRRVNGDTLIVVMK